MRYRHLGVGLGALLMMAVTLAQPMTGTFSGTLPCADCSGLQTVLTLTADTSGNTGKYTLVETYIGKTKPATSKGTWTIVQGMPSNAKAVVYQLNPQGAGQAQYYWQVNNTQLQQLTAQRQKIKAPATMNFTLTKTTTAQNVVQNPQQLANPASKNCIAKGGKLVMQKRGDGGQYGVCLFDDNKACEEWALMRGHCPVGGVKTTGYTTDAQKYCAWLGGRTLAVANAKCKLPSGKVCDDVALYNGKCNS